MAGVLLGELLDALLFEARRGKGGRERARQEGWGGGSALVEAAGR